MVITLYFSAVNLTVMQLNHLHMTCTARKGITRCALLNTSHMFCVFPNLELITPLEHYHGFTLYFSFEQLEICRVT